MCHSGLGYERPVVSALCLTPRPPGSGRHHGASLHRWRRLTAPSRDRPAPIGTPLPPRRQPAHKPAHRSRQGGDLNPCHSQSKPDGTAARDGGHDQIQRELNNVEPERHVPGQPPGRPGSVHAASHARRPPAMPAPQASTGRPAFRCRWPQSTSRNRPPLPHLRDGLEQMRGRSTQPVQPPDHEGVPRPKLTQQLAQLRPLGEHSGLSR